MVKLVNAKLPSVTRSLPIALMQARERAMTPIRTMLAQTGLTEQQWRILRVLSEYGPQDATAISEKACLLLPSLTRILRTMDQKGLTVRTTDKADRRRQEVAITPLGQKILDDNHEEAMRIVSNFRRQLGEEKYETLLDLLNEFAEAED